jgi:hypothetical protein
MSGMGEKTLDRKAVAHPMDGFGRRIDANDFSHSDGSFARAEWPKLP